MQVIGIDPGLINTGWAVIEEDGPKIRFMEVVFVEWQ